jgi:NAD(P)-dependent dehydrogenase (short-subunit alcohol dehydrogenase family)
LTTILRKTRIAHIQYQKQIAIVTGSSKGIGKVIALAFVKSNEYSSIVVDARRNYEAQMVSDEIKKYVM